MGGRGRGSRRGIDRPPAESPTDAPTKSSRSALDLFVLTARHAEELAHLASLRPDLAARFDLRLVEPGSESIESLSARAHEWLVDRGFDFAVFRLLCDLNSDRIAAELAHQVDEQGFPCDEQELLAEIYSRLQRYYLLRGADAAAAVPASDHRAFERMTATSIYRGLAEACRQLIDERRSMLAAHALPSIDLNEHVVPPTVAPPEPLVLDAARRLAERRFRLPLGSLRQWTAHALLQLPSLERRLLHLRWRRERPLAEIAERVGMAPFETGVWLGRSLEHLLDEIDRLVMAHDPNAASAVHESTRDRPLGKIVAFPRRTPSADDGSGLSAGPANAEDEGERDE
jgi:DNA-directed RNA polymerase specialized sigma24 family protein